MKPKTQKMGAMGLPVAVMPRDGATVAAIQLWFSTGAVDEREGEEGLAHFSEHMLFRLQGGAKSLHEQIAILGGDIGALTSHDWTQIHLWVPTENWDKALKALLMMLCWRAPTEEEVEAEKKVILEELAVSEGEPVRQLTHGVLGAIFGDHPYGRTVAGSSEQVNRITAESVHRFLRRGYGTDRATLWVAGAVTEREVAEALNQFDGSRAHQGMTREAQKHHLLRGGRYTGVSTVLPSPVFMVAYFLDNPDSGERELLRMTEMLLGHGRGSLIGRFATGASSHLLGGAVSLFQGREHAVLSCLLQFKGGKEQVGLQEILDELEGEGLKVDRSDVEKCLVQMQANEHFSVESTSQWLTSEAQAYAEGREVSSVSEVVMGIEELHNIIPPFFKALLRPENRTIGVLGPRPFETHLEEEVTIQSEQRHEHRISVPKIDAVHRVLPSFGRGAVTLHSLDHPSGLRIVVEERPEARVSGMVLLYPKGIADEPSPGMAAASILGQTLEDVVVGGEVPKSFFERRGGAFVGFSRLDSLGVQAVAHGEHIIESTALFLRAALSSTPSSASQFERLKRLQIDWINGELPGAQERAQSSLRGLIFGGSHPYSRTGMGTLAAVEEMTLEAFESFRQAALHDSAPILSIVGPVQSSDILALVDQMTAGRSWEDPRGWDPGASGTGSGLHDHVAEGERQSYIAVGALGPAYAERDRVAHDVYVAAMCGFRSPLSHRLREERGLVYALSGESMTGGQGGAWWIETATLAENTDVVLEELKRMIQSEAGRLESSLIEQTLSAFKGRYHMVHERALTRALGMARHWHYGLPPRSVEEEASVFHRLSVEDVQEVGLRWVRDAKLSSAILTV